MEQISKEKSIQVFEDFSKSKFSSVKFSSEGSIYRLTPSPIGITFLNIFNLAILITPHLLYFFGHFSKSQQWNNLLYIVFIVLSLLLIWLLVSMVSAYEIIINNVIKEVELIPKDFVGKYIKKVKRINIDDIASINELRLKTKSREEVYLTILTKEGVNHRLFSLSNWDNVTKLKAAFTALVFNQVTSFDDSNEPSVIIDNTIEKLLNEKDGESSYLPMIVFFSLILVLIAGFVLFFGFGKINSYCAQVDSLWLLILKIWIISMLIYAVPIYFAANTAYQKRRKATRKTIVVFSLMAMLGVYFCCSGLISYLNVKLDHSQSISKQAKVVSAYYSMGSKNNRSYYTIVLQIDSIPDKIVVKHHDPHLQANLKSTIKVSIFNGYFNKRWLQIYE